MYLGKGGRIQLLLLARLLFLIQCIQRRRGFSSAMRPLLVFLLFLDLFR